MGEVIRCMKQKDKWAEEYSNRSHSIEFLMGFITQAEKLAFLAGFEFAKKQLLQRTSLPEIHDIVDLGKEKISKI